MCALLHGLGNQPLFLHWWRKLDVNQHASSAKTECIYQGRLNLPASTHQSFADEGSASARVCVHLNLNETSPLKVSAERAGTLSSVANGVLMIQRSHMLTGAHPCTPSRHTHTHTPNHPHRHMKKQVQCTDK